MTSPTESYGRKTCTQKKSNRNICCEPRSQEMVRERRAVEQLTPHSSANYTLFEHARTPAALLLHTEGQVFSSLSPLYCRLPCWVQVACRHNFTCSWSSQHHVNVPPVLLVVVQWAEPSQQALFFLFCFFHFRLNWWWEQDVGRWNDGLSLF